MSTQAPEDFEPFGKIARLSRLVVVTEKLDGTNAQIVIGEDGSIRAGSRSRWVTVADDNQGFARWVDANSQELLGLGVGRHFGEWWGCGIQRGYELKEKRFSLFNTGRWNATTPAPACCHVVPVLWAGFFDTTIIGMRLDLLRAQGSVAAPGFMKPEGLIVFHTAGNLYFKKTLDRDEEWKGKQQ